MKPQLKKFVDEIGKNAVAIIPAAHEKTRSYDTEYKFRQDSDFWYLTDFPEPDAIAVITPDKRTKYTMFVRPRDPEMETWYGRREGTEGAEKNYGVHKAYSIEKFEAQFAKMLDGCDTLYYRFGVDKKLDKLILEYLAGQRVRRLKTAYPPHTIMDPTLLIHEMRLHKTEEEIGLMATAGKIGAEAHILAMKNCKPGMNESQIESIIEHHFRMNGAAGSAYNSIIGGGENATILHYVENNAELKNGDLLLIDAGCEYQGYASDITRTFPVNGKYTRAQKDIYEIVLETQKACIEATVTGTTIVERQNLSIEMLTEGMKKVGLLKGATKTLIKNKKYMKYYMHGVGHYIGMDVHDAGRYFTDQTAKNSRAFAPGMVLTVEPGLYIPPDDKSAPAKYRGIGIRIEDDVLVTKDGNRNLSAKVPKEINEIEALMNGGKRKAKRAGK